MCGQSAANAAGSVPPMTKSKNRPDGAATSPGSAPTASSSTTTAGSVGPSGSDPSRLRTNSSADALAFTFRFGIPSSQPERMRVSPVQRRPGVVQL
jgi:hypothetical protein